MKRTLDQVSNASEDDAPTSPSGSYKKQRKVSTSVAPPSQWQFHQEKGKGAMDSASTTTTTICTNTTCYGKKIPIHFFKTKRSNSMSGTSTSTAPQMWSPTSTTSPATNSEIGSIQGGGETDAFRLSPRLQKEPLVNGSPSLSPLEEEKKVPAFRYWPEDTWISVFLEILQADHAMKLQIAELQQQVATLKEQNIMLQYSASQQ